MKRAKETFEAHMSGEEGLLLCHKPQRGYLWTDSKKFQDGDRVRVTVERIASKRRRKERE